MAEVGERANANLAELGHVVVYANQPDQKLLPGAVKAAGAPEVDKRKVEVGQPIKALGDYTVQVRLHPEVTAKIDVKVVSL